MKNFYYPTFGKLLALFFVVSSVGALLDLAISPEQGAAMRMKSLMEFQDRKISHSILTLPMGLLISSFMYLVACHLHSAYLQYAPKSMKKIEKNICRFVFKFGYWKTIIILTLVAIVLDWLLRHITLF